MPNNKAINKSISLAFNLSLITLLAFSGCSEQSASKDQSQPANEFTAVDASPPTKSVLDEYDEKQNQVVNEATEDETQAEEDEAQEESVNSADGYPTGQSTPEGAACDLARAFITADGELFKSVCYSWSGGEAGEEYTEFINEMVENMNSMQGKSLEQFGGPKEITAAYKARHLTNNGPGSYGFAVMNLHDVMFVDVIANTWEDSTFMSRTLVVLKNNQKWYVVPRTDLFPLLSAGLNSEADSTVAWDDE